MIRKAVIVMLTLAALGTTVAGIGSRKWVKYDASSPHRFGASRRLPFTDRFFVAFTCNKESILSPTLRLSQVVYLAPNDPLPKHWHYEVLGIGGFGHVRDYRTNKDYFRSVNAPFWFLALILAAYPAIAFIRGPFRRWRRRRRGLCLRCGYDLEGNVSGVCPECGEAR